MVFPSFYLIFCQFQPGVAYKSIAYKKACIAKKLAKEHNVLNFIVYFNFNNETPRFIFEKQAATNV